MVQRLTNLDVLGNRIEHMCYVTPAKDVCFKFGHYCICQVWTYLLGSQSKLGEKEYAWMGKEGQK